VDYGRAAILVDIEDHSDIAQAMLTLTRHRELALDIVSYGRQMIQNRFSLDRVVDMHLEYYQDIIDQH
jgi:glycosyltransferase involved in cell wall biosynthesis